MEFAFTPDQQLFAATVRDLLADRCPPDRVRESWSGPVRDDLWSRLTEMGVVGMMVPESAGGMGLTDVDLHLLLIESGRVALPEPIVETAAVAARVLAEADDPRLAALADGELTVAVGFEPEGLVRTDADLVLVGLEDTWRLAPTAAWVDTAETSVDGSRQLGRLRRDPPEDATVIELGAASVANGFDRAVVGDSAVLIGLGQHLLDATVEYVSSREQFGRPIGSYQALKHKLADVLLALEFARPMAARAAHSMATGHPDRSVHASMAKAFAAQAGSLAATHALQCHGAIAYTVEYDLQLWMKRIWALQRHRGDAAWHRRRIASAVLVQPPSG